MYWIKSTNNNTQNWNVGFHALAIYTAVTTTCNGWAIIINICNEIASTLPVKDRVAIICEHNESIVGRHKVVLKIYLLVKETIWNNMRTQIQEIIGQWLVKYKNLSEKRQDNRWHSSTPLVKHSIKLPSVSSDQSQTDSNTHILMMQDLLIKYSVYASLSNTSAEFTATAFVNYFVVLIVLAVFLRIKIETSI